MWTPQKLFSIFLCESHTTEVVKRDLPKSITIACKQVYWEARLCLVCRFYLIIIFKYHNTITSKIYNVNSYFVIRYVIIYIKTLNPTNFIINIVFIQRNDYRCCGGFLPLQHWRKVGGSDDTHPITDNIYFLFKSSWNGVVWFKKKIVC